MKTVILVIGVIIGLMGSSIAAEPKTSNTLLKGVVKDEKTGETLAGVKVNIKGTSIIAYTNFDGEFEIKRLPAGTYDVCLQMVAYRETVIEYIAAKPKRKSKKIEFLMTPAIKMLGYNKSKPS